VLLTTGQFPRCYSFQVARYRVPRPRKLNLESTGQRKGTHTPSSSALLCLRHHTDALTFVLSMAPYWGISACTHRCHLYVYIKLYIGHKC